MAALRGSTLWWGYELHMCVEAIGCTCVVLRVLNRGLYTTEAVWAYADPLTVPTLDDAMHLYAQGAAAYSNTLSTTKPHSRTLGLGHVPSQSNCTHVMLMLSPSHCFSVSHSFVLLLDPSSCFMCLSPSLLLHILSATHNDCALLVASSSCCARYGVGARNWLVDFFSNELW